MKTLFTFLCVALFSVFKILAQDAGDSAYVAGWATPVLSWWPKLPTEMPAQKQAYATEVASFDAVGCDFDAEWAKIPGDGNVIGSVVGNPLSNKGPDDFKAAAFKVFYDADNFYVLLKYTDDDVLGTETVEIAWAPYLKLKVPDIAGLTQAWYARFTDFGGYKATYKKTGFDAAMLMDGSTGTPNWGGTNDILSTNLFMDDHTATGSKTIKQIFSIGYAALTGPARPNFNPAMWKTLNGGKGISFDMKVNDFDTDDVENTATPPAIKPAEYWWNTTNNDCWALTCYAGFLSINTPSGVVQQKSVSSIFSKVTPEQIQFNKAANATIYNALGQQIIVKKNVFQISLSNLENGVYIIRANNETRKFIR
jgi:hypothetical protein